MIKREEEDINYSDMVYFGEQNFFFIAFEYDKTLSFGGATLLATILGKVKLDLFSLHDLIKTELLFSVTLLRPELLLFGLFLL